MKKLIIVVIVFIIGVIYYIFNPSNYSIFPKCPFLLLSGFKCAGCGSQRAIHSLLNLDIVSAFRYNMFLVISIPIILVLIWAEINRLRLPNLYAKIHNSKIIIGYLVITILWGVFRNIYSL
ncbi:MAG: DUF2752 domain-containing protein [Bacteroidales bacterium]